MLRLLDLVDVGDREVVAADVRLAVLVGQQDVATDPELATALTGGPGTELGGRADVEPVDVLGLLAQQPEDLDWFYVSPAAEFGAWTPGERKGEFRLGGDVLVTDENGKSHIGGDDFAIAYVDEIEQPKHRRARFTVAY